MNYLQLAGKNSKILNKSTNISVVDNDADVPLTNIRRKPCQIFPQMLDKTWAWSNLQNSLTNLYKLAQKVH